jgi:hypothetical protein
MPAKLARRSDLAICSVCRFCGKRIRTPIARDILNLPYATGIDVAIHVAEQCSADLGGARLRARKVIKKLLKRLIETNTTEPLLKIIGL